MVQLLLLFIAASGLLTITPGVDTAMVLRTSTSAGPRGGAWAAIGICLGLLVWGTSAAFGLTALLAASELAFTIVKWAGASYLVYLGVKLLLWPRASLGTTGRLAGSATVIGGTEGCFHRGLLSNVLNPKVGVFYVTFLPQFIPHGVNVAAFSLLLAGIHVVLTLVWFSLLIALTVPLGRFLLKPKVVRNLDRVTGCVFVGFGLKLALAND
jgi:threonine/homoserine/homoserine lactone efflux protein